MSQDYADRRMLFAAQEVEEGRHRVPQATTHALNECRRNRQHSIERSFWRFAAAYLETRFRKNCSLSHGPLAAEGKRANWSDTIRATASQSERTPFQQGRLEPLHCPIFHPRSKASSQWTLPLGGENIKLTPRAFLA
jgi:hypothetical protein